MNGYIKLNAEQLKGSTVMITGATGLIGKSTVKLLIEFNRICCGKKINVIAVVRDIKKAEICFKDYMCDELKIHVSDVCEFCEPKFPVDYIIHAASMTSSKAFVNEPVETIFTALDGTRNLLEFARYNRIKGFVYLSSMEVYGTPTTDDKVGEGHSTNINSMSARSCYPESKRMCESLCAAYYYEYGVPVKVIRLTQTFGPGVKYNDGRVFAEFARCAIEKKDIILNTKGKTKRNYLYTEDAVGAILTVLCKGKNGEAYNAANEETYCSIYDMALLVAKECANDTINVVINEKEDISKFGYAATLRMNLDVSKINSLGWHAETNLIEMYKKMIADMN